MSNLTGNLYATSESRLDTVGSFTEGQIETWKMIRVAYKDYTKDFPADAERSEIISSFILWLNSTWGIKLNAEDSMFAKDFRIVDEKKHLLFTLKYKHLW